MQKQKSWLVYWFILLMFTLSSCGGGGGGGTNSQTKTNQQDKVTISLDSSNGGVANGETNVTLSPTLALAFSKPMQPETINTDTVILTSSSVNPNTKDGQAVAITSLTPNADNTVFMFYPTEPLKQNTKYYVYVTQGAKSANGAELNISTQLSFTTGTIVVPKVSMVNPANNAQDVSRSINIQLKFSESVNGVSTNNVTLHENSESGTAVVTTSITKIDNITGSFEI